MKLSNRKKFFVVLSATVIILSVLYYSGAILGWLGTPPDCPEGYEPVPLQNEWKCIEIPDPGELVDTTVTAPAITTTETTPVVTPIEPELPEVPEYDTSDFLTIVFILVIFIAILIGFLKRKFRR